MSEITREDQKLAQHEGHIGLTCAGFLLRTLLTDLAHQIGGLVGGDGAADDGSTDTAGAAKSHLGWDVDVWSVLIFTKKWKMEKDGERRG
jgi:murein endopeptidase